MAKEYGCSPPICNRYYLRITITGILKSSKPGPTVCLKPQNRIALKLARGYQFRSQQVEIVRNQLDSSTYPVIICGDFNDVPNSYTYFRIKGDRKDAFTQAGRGIGRTFWNIAPTLRIDYIMTDKRFEVEQYMRSFRSLFRTLSCNCRRHFNAIVQTESYFCSPFGLNCTHVGIEGL